MGLFSRKPKPPESVKLAPRTVFLVKHDRWLELHAAQQCDSGWYVELSTNNNVLLLPGGKVISTSLVEAWLPHRGWPADVGDQFTKLKEALANEP